MASNSTSKDHVPLAVPPTISEIPVVVLYQDHAYVTVQVADGTVLTYLSDPSCAYTRNSGGSEFAVTLVPVKSTPAIVEILPPGSNPCTIQGRLVGTPDSKTITIERESDSRKCTLRYNSILEITPATEPEPDSYTLSYTGEDTVTIPPKTNLPDRFHVLDAHSKVGGVSFWSISTDLGWSYHL